MSWSAAKICLDDAKVQIPDAIVTGTGMGCLEDTEKFLTAIYDSNERLLPPTPFIQSTHNTIGAQIALILQCTNYNMTFTQRGASFENALIDSISLINDPGFQNVLVGGFDEMTSKQMILYNRLNYYKKEFTDVTNILSSNTPGTIAGEGNAFFLITKNLHENSYAEIRDVKVFNFPENSDDVRQTIALFLQRNSISADELDLLILGFNGDNIFDSIYHEVSKNIFHNVPVACFKNLCGEYHTASAFALWLSANILKRQFLPGVVSKNQEAPKSFKNILIYNHYRNINHSLILLSTCSKSGI